MKRISFLLAILLLASLACSLGAPPVENVPELASPLAPGGQSATQAEDEAPTAQVIVPAPASPCANAYMPVVAGAAWNYTISEPFPDTYTHSILAVNGSNFSEQDVFGSGVTRQGEWACQSGDLVALNPGGGASVSVDGLTSEYQTTSNSGITFPANPHPGDSWTQSVTLEGSQTINGYIAPAKNQTDTSCTAVAMETVTVPAGTFQALRVECVINMQISVTADGNPFSTTINTTSISWYAPGVGMIKTVTSGNGLDSTIELTSYTIP